MIKERKRIMVLDADERRGSAMIGLLEAEEHFVYLLETPARAMQQIFCDPPDLIILTSEVENWNSFLFNLKQDNVFGHLTVIGIFNPGIMEPTTSFDKLPVDDFLTLPLNLDELRLRVRLAIKKSQIHLDANPLTRLPGNYSIMQNVQALIDGEAPFALGYTDLDNFKAFNDRYGFSRGDEILRMTARILVNVVRQFPDSFIGHIGGDDFVFLLAPEVIEQACRQIILNFTMIASSFYDDEDRMRGYIDSVDRQGNKRKFPLITLSIAVVLSTNNNFRHFGEFSAAASEVKKMVKQLEGSNYMIDRRCSTAPPSAKSVNDG